nr:MAG TPA: hypothetical protein [Caudoviricetes sp.]
MKAPIGAVVLALQPAPHLNLLKKPKPNASSANNRTLPTSQPCNLKKPTNV